ncbi:patatin-like phospholipase family protein [Thermus thermophilus]|uniref:Putative esterase of the alpha-beta hydrolase superfamily n=1 Tax=Thermus thermophilus JL-18 TaxID=798128 RepID=H9ZR35_THETH|nr:patatin-like phospholipase family protein [Thermus thermophilus]AFH38795.1 putative esterase of the alpha-beta hydrolase superfamily [Thermus thermophilus JL-18]
MRGVALALGGGGVRGYAHLGVLAVLEEAGVPIRGLAGSSAGALAAAAWAFGYKDPWRVHEAIFDREVAELSRAGSLRALARLFTAFRRPAVVATDRIEEGLKALFGEARLEESPIPLALQAADLLTGEAVVLREGPVWKAVLASMAIPGLFPPVALAGRLLVDGDVVEKVPVRAAKALFPKVVAVDVSNPPPKEPPRTALEAALLAGEASRRRLKALALKEADVVIALDPPFPIDTFDHERLEFVYELGKHRAKERLPEVLALTRTRLRDLLLRR